MKICIVGAGSLGCLYGGILANSGHDVWLIHRRDEYVQQLNEQGIRIESPYRDDVSGDSPIDVAATVTANEVGVADLVIFLVKAHQTRTAADEHSACVGADTDVLTLQNGLRNHEYLRDAFKESCVLGGVTYQGGVSTEPGVVRQTEDGRSVIGGPCSETVKEIGAVFDEAGLNTELVSDPRRNIWQKQLVSLAIKPLAALTRLTNDRLVDDPALRTIMAEVISEAVTVAEAEGISVDGEGVLDELIEVFAEPHGEGGDGAHTSSILADIEAKRKTEIDEINGAVVDLAKDHGISVPYNRILTDLVRGLERSYMDAPSP